MAGEGAKGQAKVKLRILVFILRAMERHCMVLNRKMMIRFIYKRVFWLQKNYQLGRRVGRIEVRSVRSQFHGPNKVS